MFHVLFVCTGNVCRSPIAEGMLRHWLERDMVPAVRVSSAGTFANDGAPASTHGVTVAKENGFDTSGHEARLLHRDLIENADLVLCMEADHIFQILRLHPGAEPKTFPLGAYGVEEGGPVELTVFDPIGGELEDYRRCYAIIENHLLRAYPEIRKAISAAGPSGGGDA